MGRGYFEFIVQKNRKVSQSFSSKHSSRPAISFSSFLSLYVSLSFSLSIHSCSYHFSHSFSSPIRSNNHPATPMDSRLVFPSYNLHVWSQSNDFILLPDRTKIILHKIFIIFFISIFFLKEKTHLPFLPLSLSVELEKPLVPTTLVH